MEEVVFGGGEVVHSSLILAIRLSTGGQGGRLIGVAYADPGARVLGVAEFTDNDQLSELQVRLGGVLSLSFRPFLSPLVLFGSAGSPRVLALLLRLPCRGWQSPAHAVSLQCPHHRQEEG